MVQVSGYDRHTGILAFGEPFDSAQGKHPVAPTPERDANQPSGHSSRRSAP